MVERARHGDAMVEAATSGEGGQRGAVAALGGCRGRGSGTTVMACGWRGGGVRGGCTAWWRQPRPLSGEGEMLGDFFRNTLERYELGKPLRLPGPPVHLQA